MSSAAESAHTAQPSGQGAERHFHASLGLFDSTMIVAGSMIGSGIYIVTGDMARQIGSAGWLLVAWLRDL